MIGARRRASALSFRLWRTLRRLPRPDLVLVQNPPAFPTLAVAWFCAAQSAACASSSTGTISATRCCALRLGRWHPAVRLARWFETARRAAASRRNLCVSRGHGGISREPFRRDQARQRAVRSARRRRSCRSSGSSASGSVRGCSRGSASRLNAVGFIVCPTSWTEDEDFDVVIEAVA